MTARGQAAPGPQREPARGPGGPGMRRGPGGGGPGHFLTMPTAKARDFRGSFRRLLGTLGPEAPLIALVMVLAVVSVTFAIAGPRILGNATNILFNGVVGKQLPPGVTKDQAVAALRAHGQGLLADMLASMPVVPGQGVDFHALGRTLLFLLLVYVLSAMFSWAQGYLMAGVTQRTVYRMRRDVDEKLGRLPLSYFDRQSRGDILSRMTNDIDNIAQTLQQSLTQLITAVLTVIGVLVMMLTISPLLAGLSLLTVPVSIIITVLIASRSQKQFTAQWEQTGLLNGHVEEMHTGHSIVKVFGRQDEAIRGFDAHNEKMYDASFRAQFISGIIQPSLSFVANLNYVAIAVIGGVRVASGQLSLGDVQAFIQYSRQFTMPIVQTASIMNVMQSAVASAERVFELLDEGEEIPDVAQPKVLQGAVGRVALQGVSFRYEPETPLIQDLDLVAEPGQTVAIVGPTGAGKTTLVNLLMRFYEIDGGRITVDGIDIRELTRDNLRRTFGMVLQDTWLFSGTVRDNIAYGADHATEQQILEAATAAHVDHFVRTLPDGYATVLDDEATNVSQGERQLLTIARAFLVDPPILILDEATSSVDTRTEVLIQRAMARLMQGRTSFVIAHRLSTIRDADTILVMNHGQIVEQGTHASLMAQHGFYADLYASQFEEAETTELPTMPAFGGAPAWQGAGARAAAPTTAAAPTAALRPVPAESGGDGRGGHPVLAPVPAAGPAPARSRRRPRVWVGAAAAVALMVAMAAVLAADDDLRGRLTGATAEATAAPTVIAAAPLPVAPGSIRASGRVVPARAVTLAFTDGGIVADVEVEEGQEVAAGQVVARLDSAQQAARLTLAQADLKAAEAAVDSAAASSSAAELDAARASADDAVARLELARLQAERTVLVAPFSGRLMTLDASPGEFVASGTPVARLADVSAWLVQTDGLTESHVTGVAAGDKATVTFPALEGVALPGTVERVSPVGQTRQGDVVFTAIIRLGTGDPRLLWNMSADVTMLRAGE